MKHLLLILLLLPLSLVSDPNKIPEYDSYISKAEDGQYITVFTKPALNWRYCDKIVDQKTKKEVCKDAVGWLDRKSSVRVTGKPEIHRVQDPISGEMIDEEYVPIEYFYVRLDDTGELVTNMGKGYIEKYNISDKPMETFYGEKGKPQEPPAAAVPNTKIPLPARPTKSEKDCTATASSAQMKGLESVCRPMVEAIENLGVNDTAKLLNDVVGFCATSPPTKYPNKFPEGNVYDNFVYSKLKKKKIPPIKNEDKQYITMADVANVDVLARTLYGEMAQCYRYGLEYPMTVAKIIKNRASDEGRPYRSTFIQGPHNANKTNLMKVATTPSQFSMWQKTAKTADGKVGYNGPLHHGLCPPRELGKPFYRNKSASKFENDIWVNTMRIATEAVLFPKQFEKRTKNVTDFHYTSNLSQYKGTDKLPRGAAFIEKMTHVQPTVEGRKVNFNRCLEVWKM